MATKRSAFSPRHRATHICFLLGSIILFLFVASEAFCRVALLARDAAALDADETNIQSALMGEEMDILDANIIKSGGVDLNLYSALYMRTSAQPTAYDDPAVIGPIKARVENGGSLILEFYGYYLAQYAGVGTVSESSWYPLVADQSYFVEPVAANGLFLGTATWSPPSLPDNAAQLLAGLSGTGSFNFPVLHFTGSSEMTDFWMLLTTYGWGFQETNSDYCVGHPGLCTGDRSVHLASGPTLGGIESVPMGRGRVYRVGIGQAAMTPATHLTMGAMSVSLRRNLVHTGNLAVAGKVHNDFDGDGKTDVAVWRETTGVWYILRSSDGGMTANQWGTSGDIPAAGNYDDDAKTDIAVWRPGTGVWYILRSGDGGMTATQWGTFGDVPIH